MKQYKNFLKYLLTVNILFVLVVAGLGYRNEMSKEKITEVSNNLHPNETDEREQKVIPVGKTVGIYVNTKGILVIDTGKLSI